MFIFFPPFRTGSKLFLLPSSTKDLVRAINAFVPGASLPLPEELVSVIEAYLDRHGDEGPSERLHEELLSIWEKSVKDSPASQAAWLAILRELLPALNNPAFIIDWWDRVQEPVLNHLTEDKVLRSEAWANTLAVLTGDHVAENDGSQQLAIRLLNIWMQSTHLPGQGDSSSASLRANLIRGGLLSYGRKRPKGLLVALDAFMVQRDFRAQALTLLCEFVQSQPPHLHVVLETPLFDNILRCLQHDTSTTVVTIAVTALTMLLPNVPSSLVPYLPKLFNVYARLLFWDRERSLAAEIPGAEPEANRVAPPSDWEQCVFSHDIDHASKPNLLSYFTILYGLFPLNFLDYIRKPERYLRHADDPQADTIEVQPSEIRQKSERFRQYHVLHPNFYCLTVESEKTDLSRWLKSEASEVVADCTALCLATDFGSGLEIGAQQDFGLSEVGYTARSRADQPFLTGQAILDRSSSRDQSWRSAIFTGSLEDSRTQSSVFRRQSQSSHAPSTRNNREALADSPTLPPSLTMSTSHTNLQDMINSNKVIKSGLHQSMANDSVPSLSLSHQDSAPERPASKVSAAATVPPPELSPATPGNGSDQVSQLRKEILLLSNDLAFERYMKQQHMAHIGELKRRQLREAATEAETQNLILINRSLRNRLEEAKRSELRAKKESDNRRNLSKKWETDLAAKLKLLREEQKKWGSEGATLRRDLEVKTQESVKLTKMLCEYETTELNSKQNQQAVNDHAEEIARLKAEVNRFVELERTYQAREQEAEGRLAEAAVSISRSVMLSMQLDARDSEIQETRKLYESQIAELNKQLQEALSSGSIGLSRRKRDSKQAVESSLAASRAKMAELQRQHTQLVRKYTNLQSSFLDMNAARAQSLPMRSGIASDSSDAEISAIVQNSDPLSPIRKRSLRERGFSDPEAVVEGAQYNVTPPLDALASSSAKTALHRPSTPASGTVSSSSTAEPEVVRHYGRGGVQNSRKEKKDKDKKSSGIRGIRGFV
ncbi:hypothetical protein M406DRAFT_61444 [Cryphonectria parasitica EP155]|uniref:Tuberous sclerosis 1 n=1 Tax=Cryphonectria parasitica (strain ATCC 38755 / EP155) TaxID=660469 RepID=A0A9P4Y7N1_CRYP1|nr:uncharacterized protein M406DRAFT_61444 [Cryphonectria parasitica EP155]KAF3767595.1 hypothetical protein M406DRAFT_61444 [Cryphonectria parasitica EP155]